MGATMHLDLVPLKPRDIPKPDSPEFADFLDMHFDAGEKLVGSMPEWNKQSMKVEGTVQIIDLKNSYSCQATRKALSINEYWCGRSSIHTAESVNAAGHPHPPRRRSSFNPSALARRFSHKPVNGNGHVAAEPAKTEVERQAAVMSATPNGLYERFRRGLLEYHSENEREYIEACRETDCIQVFQPHVAEVWRLTYVTPPPTNPRTFVVLLLSREVKSGPPGERCFMNISLPFVHPDCPEKTGGEKSRVRGKYVSVERVREMEGGTQVEWKMATSSDAGGNIPRFMTNSSLASSIAEDVPSFLKWMVRRFPEGGEVESSAVVAE